MERKVIRSTLLFVALVGLASLSYCSRFATQETNMVNKAYKVENIVSLFALSTHDIMTDTDTYISQAQQVIDQIVALNDAERTFENSAKALDELEAISDLAITQHVYEALELLSPSDDIRALAHDAYIKVQQFWIEQISTNKKIYNALQAYASEQKENENLSDDQRYLLNSLLEDFKREGLSLSDEVLAQVKTLKNELSVLSADFDRNIAQDNRSISVDRHALDGLDDEFVATLAHTDDGRYSVGVDYPTYFKVMDNCTVTDTRKKLYIEFNNRAYPANDALIKQIIVKRDELARLLGYLDFAHWNIDSQMAHTPERAQSFITDLIGRSLPKVMVEKQMLTVELPESVQLTSDGTFLPWDFAFVTNWYKKKHFNIDEEVIAEYFPMEHTIAQLLDIYHQFFSIDFKQVPASGLWHEDVSVVQVYRNTELLGTLLLDLYPRPNKYSHAAHTTIIPGTFKKDGSRIPDVSIVLANFTKPTDNKPSLLKRNEVQTFFHEFGHALHAILGATPMASQSGTHTKTDFVELPSQMLEEWLWNKDILKKVSSHYQTGEPLPDEIIDTLIAAKDLTSGYWVLRQAYLSLIALSYFGPGENKEPYSMMQELHKQTMAHMIGFSPDNHFYASFGHLTGYGARYYGYLWSKVFALDIFAEIKKHGLLDPVIGQKYVKEILSKGGSQDPNELLYNFLGREPNAQAFFAEMGL